VPRHLIAAAFFVSICCGSSAADAQAPQEPAAPATREETDVGDLWRAIRHKDAAGDPQPQTGRKRTFVLAPVIGANPSSGFTFGVAGQVTGFRGPEDTTTISSGLLGLNFSTQKQAMLNLRYGLYTAGDHWFIEGDNRFHKSSQHTYDFGADSPASPEVTARYDFVRVHERMLMRVAPKLFVGGSFLFDSHSHIRPDDGAESAWSDSSFVEYSTQHQLPLDSQQAAGASVDVLFDARENPINPVRGWYANARYDAYFHGFLGGDSSWRQVHADVRTYVPLGRSGRQRLALWAYGDVPTGGTPTFFELPTTAMDLYGRAARGYRQGRIRGERLVYGEVEYRVTLTGNGLLGMVAFANTTTVSNPDTGERLFRSFAPAIGTGARILFSKHSHTNLCVDVGWGENGSRGVYFAIQEAF